MITGPDKSQIDQIWNAIWSGGISNPLGVIEQIRNKPSRVHNSVSFAIDHHQARVFSCLLTDISALLFCRAICINKLRRQEIIEWE
jgi:hypothetical protein